MVGTLFKEYLYFVLRQEIYFGMIMLNGEQAIKDICLSITDALQVTPKLTYGWYPASIIGC